MRILRFSCIVILGLLGGTAQAAQAPSQVEVVVEPATLETTLGATETIVVTVTSRAETAFDSISIHIDITDPANETSVDPEDWTPALTQFVRDLEPGQSRSVEWEVQPISSGAFSLYAVALAPGSQETAVSNVVTVAVSSNRTLNPEGVLVVAVAVPAVVGMLLAFNLRRTKRLRNGRWRSDG